MKKIFGSIILLISALTLCADKPSVTRTMLAERERTLDRLFVNQVLDDNAFLLLGGTRGVYLDGYGAVFTVELNLVPVPAITPFRQQITDDRIASFRQAKNPPSGFGKEPVVLRVGAYTGLGSGL